MEPIERRRCARRLWLRYRLSFLELLLLGLALVVLLVPAWPSGWVVLIVHPSGASIAGLRDGVSRSPGSALPVSAGGSAYRLSARDYLTLDTLLARPLPDTVTLFLQYAFPIEITSSPPGAAITLDGAPTGIVTPARLEAGQPGRHCIELMLGGVAVRDTVTLLGNCPVALHYTMREFRQPGMVFVPSGWFDPGGPEGAVWLDSFYICDHEVTVEEFLRFIAWIDAEPALLDTTPGLPPMTRVLRELSMCDFPPPVVWDGESYLVKPDSFSSHPVSGVTYHAASSYCRYLGRMDRQGSFYRLPTEAEWEYAALGGTSDAAYPWGDRPPDGSLANFSDSSEQIARRVPGLDDGYPTTAPVGSFSPNGYGLFDMAGNVWEWCIPGGRADSPPFPEGHEAPARGGSWLSDTSDCRCESRVLLDPSMGYAFTGFRVVGIPGGEEDPP